MIFRKKTAVLFSAVLVIALVSAVLFKAGVYISTVTQGTVPERRVIILDAGHGGFDGGAVAKDGTVEKDINLKIAHRLSALLKQSGFEVVMTRENDVGTEDDEGEKISSRKKSDLKNRLNLMKKYPDAVFVSIHLNKFTTSAAIGTQVFYGPKNEESKTLGEFIQQSVVKQLQPENKRVNKQATSSTFLLYNAEIPAVLVECGFLSNTAELKKLKTEEYQAEMAFSIFCGILDYYAK